MKDLEIHFDFKITFYVAKLSYEKIYQSTMFNVYERQTGR
jgi:hypothetical protein